MKNVLVDTGYWLAISNKNDSHHNSAIKWMLDNQNAGFRLATTWVVMCESFFLIKNCVSYQKSVELFEAYSRSEFDIYDLKIENSQRVIELMKKYEDIDIDLADITLVVLAERLGTGDILTVDDKDFGILRWDRKRRFKQLLR
ncbi:MAG: hypothetical protein COB30_010150 [Ectothiorhodospiraceae bacterium]|nr:hypothetical protein [Ectothiorhodospiraceae bacterium]